MSRKKQVDVSADEAFAEGYEEGIAAAEEASLGAVSGEPVVSEGGVDDAVDAARWRHAKARQLIHSDRAFTHGQVEHQPQRLQPDAADAFVDWDRASKV